MWLLSVWPDHERCALLTEHTRPTDADIDRAMSGNLCLCGTYNQIRAAIKDASVALVKGVSS